MDSRPDLRSGQGLNQCCSSCQELSNAISHSPRAHREQVDSRLLVVRSQTANLTPGPSFAHNLGCKCPNGSCEDILDIYTSRPFQRHKEHPNARCFNHCNHRLSFWESRRTPNSHFRECEWRPHTSLKVGLRHFTKWWTRSKTTSLKIMNNVTNPSCFNSTFVQ